jgi:hypothetical protein
LALQIFESDYCAGLLEKRYLKGELPKLPFQDDSFSLVLSGNLLFYYSDEFDYLFHRDSPRKREFIQCKALIVDRGSTSINYFMI